MANKPLLNPLPADLPENWQINQIVAPTGAEVGLAEQYGYNMAVMGAYLKMKPVVNMENVGKGLAKCIPARYSDLISLNKTAIEEGMKAVEVL